MEKIDDYLDKYVPQVTKLGSSGLYKVWSPKEGYIGTVGKAGLRLLKDKLILRGLQLNIKLDEVDSEPIMEPALKVLAEEKED